MPSSLEMDNRVMCAWIASVVWLLLATTTAHAQSIAVAFAADQWVVSQKNFQGQGPDFDGDGQVVNYQGRQGFRLGKGFAYSREISLQNGTIDVDMAADPKGHFLGIAFHVQSEDDYELFFFRPDDSGTPYAVQYTPGLRGGNVWQMFHGPGYTAQADIPRERWIHVRIVVAGLVAKLFLNNAAEPALIVSDLRLGFAKGGIGLWGRGGGGYFSNLSYTPDNASYPTEYKKDFAPGAITNWELSEVFDPAVKGPATYPDSRSLKWEKVEAESPGMVIVNRYRPASNAGVPPREIRLRGPVPGSRLIFARTTIHSDRNEVRKLSLGYSDEIVAYLNSRPIYAGNNTQAFRQPEFLGLLDADSEAVYLPLKKGDNELMFAITDYCCGWGFIAKLSP
jgi:hypothetical protein